MKTLEQCFFYLDCLISGQPTWSYEIKRHSSYFTVSLYYSTFSLPMEVTNQDLITAINLLSDEIKKMP